MLRTVTRILTAHHQREGGGFLVRRPFPTHGLELVDPFLLLDEMGPVTYGPGEAVGAPDHPHRGFETVTYILEGAVEHADSTGNRDTIGPGEVQWMTAGAGLIHAEEPPAALREKGGRMHGFQLWVNLPRKDKMIRPRYQPIRSLPSAATPDGTATVRVIAGEALGVQAAIDTRTPILYQHWSLRPGARIEQPIPASFNAAVYVFRGAARVGGQALAEGQLALLGAGDAVELAADSDAELLLLGGEPLREPIARYGPFVMSTPQEIREAILDFQLGRMGSIAPQTA